MKNIARTLASVLVLTYTASALAQASCSSDGIPQPVAIFERFISADCEACWSDAATPAPSATAGVAVLDWIVPGKAGDEAPLSAAATNDALARLQTLGRKPPVTTDVHTAAIEAATPRAFTLAEADTCCAPGYTGVTLRNRSADQPAFVFLADEAPLHRKLGVHEVRA